MIYCMKIQHKISPILGLSDQVHHDSNIMIYCVQLQHRLVHHLDYRIKSTIINTSSNLDCEYTFTASKYYTDYLTSNNLIISPRIKKPRVQYF